MTGSNVDGFGFGDVVRQLQEEYAAVRVSAGQSQVSLGGVSGTFTDRKGLLTVTVSVTGAVSALTFKSTKYREMAPAELSHAILEAISAGKARAVKQAEKLLPAAGLPAGVSTADLLAGTVDFSELLPVEVRSVFEVLAPVNQPAVEDGGGF